MFRTYLINAYIWKNVLNLELNDLRKNICLRKSEVSGEKIPGIMSLKKLWSMAYTACHAPIPVTS